MRIGIDYRPVTAAPFSGIARQVVALDQALSSRLGVEVLRFSAGPADHPDRAIAHFPLWSSPVNGLHRPQERMKFEFGYLPDALREMSPDVYIATANIGLPVWRTPRRIRYALLLHDVFQLTETNRHAHWGKAMAYRLIDRWSIRQSVALADQIWSPSKFTVREASRLFPGDAMRMHVLPNAVPERMTSDTHGASRRPYWLMVGTREPRKNITWFLDQWEAARIERPMSVPELILVGHEADIPEDRRGLPGLHFLNTLSDDDLIDLYAGADRLWQPSRAEGFGLPVVEALGQGTPVAVAQGSALDEVAPADAVRFDPADGMALRRLMLTLADVGRLTGEDPALLRQWAARFGMPEYTKRVWTLIDQLLTGEAS